MNSKNPSAARFVDHNATVVIGERVDGVFSHKLATAMVVKFNRDGKPCSGVLHVSQFPSNERSMRDKMFAVASVGMPAPGLTVIGVEPPSGDQRFTKVRLSARTATENATRDSQRPQQNRPSPAPTASSEVAAAPKPIATFAAPVAAPAAVITDPVTRAKQLVAEARRPARSCGFADLQRAIAISRLGSDSVALGMLETLESQLSQLDALNGDAKRISGQLSPDILEKASTLYAVRAQKRELDAQTALLRQESARYAGLCGKVKRAGDNVPTELRAQADDMKASIEAKRASLKEAYAANKKADDDADLDLLFSLNSRDIKAEMEQALGIAGELASTIAKRDQLVTDLGGTIGAYEKRLSPAK
jgi:hypothetical protein